ncbi:DUF4350 domain-containing protein [Knoellia subterranea]|uniref:DUF4350 domain-containing protein n=1 Tax=Knoellia subterranea TaxID=184882 RepID=UPI000A9D6D30|nr:DUF4350 domain-containing protein [Knoellia subterranea]
MAAVAKSRSFAAWLGAVLLGVGALAVIAIMTTPSDAAMDPDGLGPTGGAALIAVLDQNGVDVVTTRTIEDTTAALREGGSGADTSVVIGNTSNLGTAAAATLRQATLGAHRVVALSPSSAQVRSLGAEVTALRIGAGVEIESRCDIGPVDEGDTLLGIDARYELRGEVSGARACFPLTLTTDEGDAGDGDEGDGEGDHGAVLLDLPATSEHAPLTIVGSTSGFTNRAITEADNAAIALRLLGGSERLVWYHPGVTDLADSDAGTSDDGGLLPRWLMPALALVGVAIVLLGVVRGRRLGRLVHEPLPVVVRAVETTEARGRLYRRAQDRPRAAAVLRLATLDRLRSRLGLRRGDPVDVVARAASAATGRPVSEILDLVSGPAPTDDAALVRLAQDLSDLEEKAHRP